MWRLALAPAVAGAGYANLTASGKLDYLWQQCTSDTSSDGYMNPLETVIKVHDLKYLENMGRTGPLNPGEDWGPGGDWRESGHHKATHGLGAVAKAHFEWKPNPYDGLFQPGQAEHCLIRVANAAAPGGLAMGAYGPNMAVKCLTDGPLSANLQLIWQLDGYGVLPKGKTKSCSYFEAPLSNSCPLRDDLPFSLTKAFVPEFDKIDPFSMRIGVSEFANPVSGSDYPWESANASFPFALIFAPKPGLNDVPCEFSSPNSQLLNLESHGFVGKAMYDIYAVHDPTDQPSAKDLIHLGEMVLDSGFTSSKFGDTRLFFRHIFWSNEADGLAKQGKLGLERYHKWYDWVSVKQNYKTQGAGLYEPFLPKPTESVLI